MSFLEEVESLAAKLFAPLIKSAFTTAASDVTAAIPEIEAKGAAEGQTVIELADAEVLAITAKQPILALVAQQFEPELNTFLTGLEAKGVTEIGPVLNEVATWLTTEAAKF